MPSRDSLNKIAANKIDEAANIASGHGEYALANRLWEFSAKLRRPSDEQGDSENTATGH